MKKKVIAYLLGICILLSAFPVYASSLNLMATGATFNIDDSNTSAHTEIKSFPWSKTYNFKFSDVTTVPYLQFNSPISYEEGSSMVLTLKYKDTYISKLKGYVLFHNKDYTSQWRRELKQTADGVLTMSEDHWSNGVKNIYVDIVFNGWAVRPAVKDAPFSFNVQSLSVVTQSEESGFWDNVKNALTNILTWLKDIRDKIVDGITEIGNTIVTQFNNLLSNLQKLFDEVTEWLFNILDQLQEFIHKVGNWFSELYNNIAGKIDLVITDIKQWVHDLFVPDPQYMEQYRTQWNQWMQLHLGFLYQSMAIVESLMSTINNGQSNSTLIVTIPKLQLPDNFGGHVIFEGGSFNLGNELLEKHSKIKWLYTTSQAFITGLAVFWTVYFGYKKIHVLIAERSG